MNRRQFMKAGAALLASMSLPVMASEGHSPEVVRLKRDGAVERLDNHWADFDPSKRYGNMFPVFGDLPPAARDQLLHHLYLDMAVNVPPPYRGLVRVVEPPRTDYGRCGGIAWLYEPPGYQS